MKRIPLVPIAASLALAACGGGGSSPPPQGTTPPPATYTVSGTVTGLTGTLVLRVNDASDVSVAANGTVALANALANGTSYSVAVKTQPSNPTQKCDLANASGTIAAANVTNVTVTCAAVPLTLTSSMPANGASGVARDAPLTLTFSTTLDSSVGTATLTGPTGDVTATTQVSGVQLVVTPTAKLARMGAYTLNVAGLKGTGGEQLAAPLALAFTAADGSWSTPIALETGIGDTAYPRIAMDAKGNALALWVQANGAAYEVAANHWTAGAGWDGAQRVERDDLGVAMMPELRFDRDGYALAVWVQWSGSRYTTWSGRFDGASGWNGAQQISSGKDDTAWPTLDFDSGGAGLAMWENSGQLHAYDYSRSSGWTGAAFPADSAKPLRTPQLCFDSTGRAQAVWTLIDGANTQVWSNSHVVGAWAVAAVLDAVTGHVDSLRIVCQPTGGAVAAWLGQESGISHVHAAQLTDDGWTAPTRLDSGAGDVKALSLSTDAAGDVIALWAQSESTGTQLSNRRIGASRLWSPARRIDDPAAGSPAEPELALNARGEGWAVWRVAHAGRPGQIAAARVRDGEFSTPQIIDPDTVDYASAPRVAIDPDGNAIAVWLKCAAACNVMASRFE